MKLKKKSSFILRAIWLTFESQAVLKSYHLVISSENIHAIDSGVAQDVDI